MTTLSALHFPETILSPRDIMGQSLLFDTVSYITPTASQEDPEPLCPAYDPAPLGDDAERFGQLLDELKGNETAFYQGQMSTLALEYLETRDDDTVRDIIKNVQGEKTTKKSPEELKEFEQIWQARLLLKLAEIMRREEQDVHDSLQRIKDAQEEMLGDLKGEEEFQDLFNAIEKSLPNQMPVRVEALIKAWGRLFSQGSAPFTALHCFGSDAAEPFMEVSEAITGNRPVRLLRLPLPNCGASAAEFQDKKSLWQQENSSWLAELKTALTDVCKEGLDNKKSTQLSQFAAKWASSVDQTQLWPDHTPTKKCGPPALEIYLLGADMYTLTARLCNSEAKPEQKTCALLAFVTRRPNTCN